MPVKTWSTPVTKERNRAVPCAVCGAGHFVPHYRCEHSFEYVRCGRCGLVQINPQPLREEVARRYGAGAEKKEKSAYLAYELANEKTFLRLQELSLRDSGFLRLEKKLLVYNGRPRILDIGCASGAMLETLLRRGWDAEGVEISPAQAEYCKNRGLRVSSLPLEENHFPDNHFEAVLASHVIEHLNDPALFVKEIYRVLKPQGRCFITTPNIDGLQSKIFKGAWRSAIFDHLYLFSKKTLRMLLETSGLIPEKTITWGGLALGAGPKPLKKPLDFLAKRLGAGDVMLIRAVKNPARRTRA
ncbi:MAG: class I SAM-dependent methyltransferase [Treponema sp.]|jgi:2-polyprenyl-3-methyl-5-hydroxy-6-metoxy-1,4-benzoquinol methylase|nr:class I SAM-dependent methyltransferase [Treponema sp.]